MGQNLDYTSQYFPKRHTEIPFSREFSVNIEKRPDNGEHSISRLHTNKRFFRQRTGKCSPRRGGEGPPATPWPPWDGNPLRTTERLSPSTVERDSLPSVQNS